MTSLEETAVIIVYRRTHYSSEGPKGRRLSPPHSSSICCERPFADLEEEFQWRKVSLNVKLLIISCNLNVHASYEMYFSFSGPVISPGSYDFLVKFPYQSCFLCVCSKAFGNENRPFIT